MQASHQDDDSCLFPFWLKLGPKGPDNACKLIPPSGCVCQNTPLEAALRLFWALWCSGGPLPIILVLGLFLGITVISLGFVGLIIVISLGFLLELVEVPPRFLPAESSP